jgi:hypothetical protein
VVTTRLPYGKEEIQFDVPKRRISAILLPREVSASDAYATVRQALQSPVESPPLTTIWRGWDSNIEVICKLLSKKR